MIWDASTAPPEFTKDTFAKRKNTLQKGENTMSKKNKKIEKKDAKVTKAAKAPELSEQELEKAAGGGGSAGFLKA